MQRIAEPTGYRAALENAAYFEVESGTLQLEGADRVDFLQRQTTNDVRLLSENRAIQTVLTSPTARILDVLWLFANGETIISLTLPTRGASTAAFLRSKIFFMDKVTLEDQTTQFRQLDLDGPALAERLTSLGIDLPPIDQVQHVELAGANVVMIGRQGFNGVGVRLIVPASDLEEIKAALENAGIEGASSDAYEMLRLESGQPGIAELTEEFTPLEVSMNHTISDSKGCYTGQEIIARQITYDKVTRSLIGLRLSAPVEPQTKVFSNGRSAGVVTSSGISPRFGAIALAVVRRPLPPEGAELSLGESGDMQGIVSALPFTP